jgi:hypothetical protein
VASAALFGLCAGAAFLARVPQSAWYRSEMWCKVFMHQCIMSSRGALPQYRPPCMWTEACKESFLFIPGSLVNLLPLFFRRDGLFMCESSRLNLFLPLFFLCSVLLPTVKFEIEEDNVGA